ncbi:MAG: hypothetical protein MZV49_21605 [Rhodopseudomonas palustris]|nr:hypothetical protein [Rhodopseudomonas palustris]
MLIVKDDVCIIDFEGEPRRSLAERRAQGTASPRRRRAAALDRLFHHRGAGARLAERSGGAWPAHRRAGGLARPRQCRFSQRLPRDDG